MEVHERVSQRRIGAKIGRRVGPVRIVEPGGQHHGLTLLGDSDIERQANIRGTEMFRAGALALPSDKGAWMATAAGSPASTGAGAILANDPPGVVRSGSQADSG
jgi:hypothetical protein